MNFQRHSTIILLISLIGNAYGEGDDLYNVNTLMEESLEEFNTKVVRSNDITVHLAHLTLGKYTMRDVRLGDLSSLRRAGDCWMWNEGQTVFVNGTAQLRTMFLVADRIQRPNNIPQPLITFRDNSVDFLIAIELDAKAFCSSSFDLRFSSLNGVTLYSDDTSANDIDISELVGQNLRAISRQLVPGLAESMKNYSHMCSGKHLNRIAMIKHGISRSKHISHKL